ncbi:MAG TPA: hypothetical protein VJR27_04645 [Candidatus Saccharimonadales bacterium]|nr:hypothetical protein [Candidatus Saccharimonadales bacterium]
MPRIDTFEDRVPLYLAPTAETLVAPSVEVASRKADFFAGIDNPHPNSDVAAEARQRELDRTEAEKQAATGLTALVYESPAEHNFDLASTV